ncbi:hypothetical protein [Arhodomonas sp. AD133]|uniref:hypothetical protein n=1 Tax=Arhodomonas sp. AD133 TaxID=3415009 RepID=UPI003EBF4B2A
MEYPTWNVHPMVIDGIRYDSAFPDVIECYAQMSSASLIVTLNTFAQYCLGIECDPLRVRDAATVGSGYVETDNVPAGWLIYPDALKSFEWAEGEDTFRLAAHRGCRFMLLRVPACQVHLFRSAGIESPTGHVREAQARIV